MVISRETIGHMMTCNFREKVWRVYGREKIKHKVVLCIAFFIIGVIAYMDRSNISIIAGPMMEDLHMNKTQFGLLASFFSLGYALMQVPSGFLAEKFGSKKC